MSWPSFVTAPTFSAPTSASPISEAATPARKSTLPDPFTGKPVRVLAVKGSGGDIGSIKESGFALLYHGPPRTAQRHLSRRSVLKTRWWRYYPLSAFGENQGRRLHRYAAACFSALRACGPSAPRLGHRHRRQRQRQAQAGRVQQAIRPQDRLASLAAPRFRTGSDAEQAVEENPGCDGILLGSHGLFTWGNTQRECYVNSIHTIDQMGAFIAAAISVKAASISAESTNRDRRGSRQLSPPPFCPLCAASSLPTSASIAHYADHDDALDFAGSEWAKELWRIWAPVAPIISCARASARCLSTGSPATEGIDVLKKRIEEARRRNIANRIRQVL